MAWLSKIELPDIPQHIFQRGNNHNAYFCSEDDCCTYLHWLKDYSEKYCVYIHAWVLMTNHLNLFCIPQKPKAISLLKQSLGKR